MVRISYFDGVYELVRVCMYLGHGLYRVFDIYPDGTEEPVTYLGAMFVDASAAIILMEHTYNMNESDIKAIVACREG